MIDTVRFDTTFQPNVEPDEKQGWSASEFTTRKRHWRASFKRFKHKSGIRLVQSPKGWSVEASLPRLLYGSNAKLLKSQKEIDSALATMRNHVESATKSRLGIVKFTRVDLCWHIPGRIVDFIAAHWNLSHRETRGGKVIIYRDETIIWETKSRKGHKKELRLQMYDKRRQKTGRTRGNLIRLEIQLRGDKLREHLGSRNQQPTRLDFDRCYLVLRKMFCAFPKCRLFELCPKRFDAPAKRRLEEFGICWERLLPRKPCLVFKTRHGCDLPDVPAH